MSSSNVVVLRGNLVGAPEYAGKNNSMAKFTMAVSYSGSNSENADDKTGFFDCVCFLNNSQGGKFLGRMMQDGKINKGSGVEIVGSLDHRRWKNENGEWRSKVSVIVNDFGFAGGGARKDDNTSSDSQSNNDSGKQADAGDDNFLDF